jgi:threonine dehydrogenase-like Zn-dependent dehydrogenase
LVAVLGLGPIGQISTCIAQYRGARVIGVDLLPERLAMARRHGIEVLDAAEVDDVRPRLANSPAVAAQIRSSTRWASNGTARGQPDRANADGHVTAAGCRVAHEDGRHRRLAARNQAIATVRRRGTLSIVGAYGGMADPLPMLTMLRQRDPDPDGPGARQALDRPAHAAAAGRHGPRAPHYTGGGIVFGPLGVEDLTTQRLPLDQAAHGYDIFQKKAGQRDQGRPQYMTRSRR